jgi:hypothetical protein
VSTNPGNAAIIGSDGRIFVPDEVYIGTTNPDTIVVGNVFELWVDSDAETFDFPDTYAEETAMAAAGTGGFPPTYGAEKSRAAGGV